MTQNFHTCRLCDDGIMRDEGMVKYSSRHWAHYRCYLAAGKPLSALPAWKVGEFPYFLLKEHGLLDEAKRLASANRKWRFQ